MDFALVEGGERRGRLWGEGSVSLSGSDEEAEREGWEMVGCGAGEVIVKVIIDWTFRESKPMRGRESWTD